MAGLKISICFWHLDPTMVDDLLLILKKGKIEVKSDHCKKRGAMRDMLINDPPNLVISDFDLPEKQREVIEEEMGPFFSEVPMIYLVGEKNERKAAESLKLGVWDYVLKGKLYKLIPSVYSSQKYSMVIKQRQEAELALSESRDRYLSIFKSANDGFLLFDVKTFSLTDYNPRILELFEIDEKEMESIGMEDFSCVEEGYTLERSRDYIEKAKKGDPVSFEWLNVTRNGRKFWTYNSFSFVRIKDKPQLLLVTRDIDNQKRMEQSLRESQEHFRALAENSPDVIMRFDREYRHIYVNKAVELQTGLLTSEFIDKSHKEMGVFPKENVQVWEEALEKVFTSGKPNTIVFDIKLGDNITAYEWRLYPEIGNSEAIGSVIGVARDITNSRESQDALRQSEERLNLALTATGLGLWDWNLVTNAVYFSPIWLSMLGYGPEELPHELETWTSLQHPEDADQSLKTVNEAILNRDASFEIEFRLKHKNGSYVWIRSMGKAVAFDAEGNTTRLTGIHENINERK